MAGFVKLDSGMLNSTVWHDRDVRDVFITALLMAELRELREPTPQLEVASLEKTGWDVPPGWYGFVPAASTGILARAGISTAVGMPAIVQMGRPEPESRSSAFDGRRLVRVDGGFVVLNYMRYRERDYTAADRMARYRARKSSAAKTERPDEIKLGRLASLEVKSKP